MQTNRRKLLTGLGATLFLPVAPAIVHAGNIMPVKLLRYPLPPNLKNAMTSTAANTAWRGICVAGGSSIRRGTSDVIRAMELMHPSTWYRTEEYLSSVSIKFTSDEYFNEFARLSDPAALKSNVW